MVAKYRRNGGSMGMKVSIHDRDFRRMGGVLEGGVVGGEEGGVQVAVGHATVGGVVAVDEGLAGGGGTVYPVVDAAEVGEEGFADEVFDEVAAAAAEDDVGVVGVDLPGEEVAVAGEEGAERGVGEGGAAGLFFAIDAGDGGVVVEGLVEVLAVDGVEGGEGDAGRGVEDAVDPTHEVFVEGGGDEDVVGAGVVLPPGFGTDVPGFGVVEVFGEDEDALGGVLPAGGFVAGEADPIAAVVGECAAVEQAVVGDFAAVAAAEGAALPFVEEAVFEGVDVRGRFHGAGVVGALR